MARFDVCPEAGLLRDPHIVIATPDALSNYGTAHHRLGKWRSSCSMKPTECSTWDSPRNSQDHGCDSEGTPDHAFLRDDAAGDHEDRERHMKLPVRVEVALPADRRARHPGFFMCVREKNRLVEKLLTQYPITT